MDTSSLRAYADIYVPMAPTQTPLHQPALHATLPAVIASIAQHLAVLFVLQDFIYTTLPVRALALALRPPIPTTSASKTINK